MGMHYIIPLDSNFRRLKCACRRSGSFLVKIRAFPGWPNPPNSTLGRESWSEARCLAQEYYRDGQQADGHLDAGSSTAESEVDVMGIDHHVFEDIRYLEVLQFVYCGTVRKLPYRLTQHYRQHGRNTLADGTSEELQLLVTNLLLKKNHPLSRYA